MQIRKALLSIASRAVFSSSEHKTAQLLKVNSGLKECFEIEDYISHKQLYAITDKLYQHKDSIDDFL